MTDAGPTPPDTPLIEPLTRREREILGLLAQGYSAPEMAEQLTLALSSVKSHQLHLYDKLRVHSKRQALTRARALGLLDVPLASAGSEPASAPKHNLPLPVTRFFGRETEIGQLKQRLSQHRLVTLTGSGGVGKTRLALRVAEDVLANFPDGVWLSELAPLSDPALIARQIAASLGLPDEPERSIQEGLLRFLQEREALLILDNCEHLLEACAQLAARLLAACPRLRLLASSREPLGLAGEAIFLVPSLSFPDPLQLPPAPRLTDYMAISLLLDRARLVQPDYEVTARNAAALARICQRLDGIPLAIEMAAARLNILDADQLAARLDDVFRLLTGGGRSALPRQQTLRATLDWSYQLLNGPERQLLQRLSVFAGGCTLEAAENICKDPAQRTAGLGEGGVLHPSDVLDLLAQLANKSLVLVERPAAGQPRYRLLEIVRQYAREKLIEAGDSERLRARHRDYFLWYVENTYDKVESAERLLWTRRLKAEYDNLRAATEWSFGDQGNLEAGPRLVEAMRWPTHQEWLYWTQRSVDWCERHPAIPRDLFATVLGHASRAITLSDPPAALRLAQRAVEVSRALGPAGQETLLWCLVDLGYTYLEDLSQPEAAVAPLAEAEAIFEKLPQNIYPPETYQRARLSFQRTNAALAYALGHYQTAKDLARDNIRLRQASGDRWASSRSHMIAGEACLKLGEYDQARGHFLAAGHLVEESEGLDDASVLYWLAAVELRQGQLEQARQYSLESLGAAAQARIQHVIASCLDVAALIEAARGQAGRAATLAGAAAAIWQTQGRQPRHDSSLDTLFPGYNAGPDAAAISAAFDAGQAMDADEAVAYALDEEPE